MKLRRHDRGGDGRNTTVLVTLLILLFGQMCSVYTVPCTQDVALLPIKPEGVITFQDSLDRVSNSTNYRQRYYRYFYVDNAKDYLYVGAMQRLYRLPLSDIAALSSDEARSEEMFPFHENQQLACVATKGPNSHVFSCQNHIRVISEDKAGSLYVCGTGAHSPREFKLDSSNLTVTMNGTWKSGITKCPFDPNDNATAVWVDNGNPGNIPSLYSATVTDVTKADPVIYRPELNSSSTLLRTVKHDSKWLNEPDFVKSFDVGDHIFFFFRETAVEYINCGKAKFARVARVCKKDRGGLNSLKENWTTFMKARLNCSIPGEFPYYFNELHDISMVTDENNRTVFYGAFTTNQNGLYGSAVCSFSKADIDAAFNGPFKEQKTYASTWLPVLPGNVPVPRPGLCINNSLTLPDSVLTFIQNNPLMDRAVANQNGQPIYYTRDVIFQKISVYQAKVSSKMYPVLFLGTNQGFVYKIAAWGSGNNIKSNLISIWKPFESIYPIWNMDVQAKSKSLYLGTDLSVTQIPVDQCALYNRQRKACGCCKCIQDPVCGWDVTSETCTAYRPGLLSGVEDKECTSCNTNQTLGSADLVSDLEIVASRMVHLNNTKGVECVWYIDTQSNPKKLPTNEPHKYTVTRENGLIIFDVTVADNGYYQCCDPRNLATALQTYKIYVTDTLAELTSPREYYSIFNKWKEAFKTYQTEFSTWKSQLDSCTTGTNTGPGA